MAYCEECGATLNEGDKFCELCGAPVEVVASAEKVAGCAEKGIIITRESVLLGQLGADSTAFGEIINWYIKEAVKRGVGYTYINLDSKIGCTNKPADVVRELCSLVREYQPKYLFILGNEDVIGVQSWENRSQDSDSTVDSDLCYSTLDLNSPFEGQKYDFDSILRVGRLPSYDGEELSAFEGYLSVAASNSGRIDEVKAYGLSAHVWEDESNDEFKAVSSKRVETSPDIECEDVEELTAGGENLFFFNLHGSNQTKYWYGQEGGDYPEAVEPLSFEGDAYPFFLGVEACYGAKFIGGLEPKDSILLTALQNYCMAFLGSSKIAYGTSRPDGCCADLVVGEYIKCLAKGYSAGDAHVAGLKRLMGTGEVDDSEIKTLAEFALYGDPSVRMMDGGASGGKSFTVTTRPLTVSMPNVLAAVRMELTKVSDKINALIDDYANSHNLLGGNLSAADSKVFKMGSNRYQKIYSFDDGKLKHIAKVYFDGNGAVKKAVVSK